MAWRSVSLTCGADLLKLHFNIPPMALRIPAVLESGGPLNAVDRSRPIFPTRWNRQLATSGCVCDLLRLHFSIPPMVSRIPNVLESG